MKLEEQKIQKEIELLDAELDLRERQKLYTNLKIALGTIVVLLLLLLVIKPETVLNQRPSAETIDRERARLLINVLAVDDPEMRKINLEILNDTYLQGEDDWWTGIQQRLNAEVDHELEISLRRQLHTLMTKKADTQRRLESGELSDTKAQIAEQSLELYNLEIARLERELQEI